MASTTGPKFFFLGLLLVAISCQSIGLGNEENTTSVEVNHPYNEVLNASYDVISQRYGVESFDRQGGVLESSWNHSMRRGKDIRTRVTVRVLPNRPGESSYRLKLSVFQQETEEIGKTFATSSEDREVDWEDRSADAEVGQDLLHAIRWRLKGDEEIETIMEEVEKQENLEKRLEELEKEEDDIE